MSSIGRGWLLGWLAIGLALSACGSSEPVDEPVAVEAGDEAAAAEPAESADAAEPSEPASGDEPADEPESGEDETPMAASSPIGAYFADDGGFDAAVEEYTARVEEEIVRCMAEQGFEFIPTGRGARESAAQQAQGELSEREWTKEYGYGISTSFDSVVQNQAGDPNAEIVFSMSAAEREAWLDTLFGADREGIGINNDTQPLEEQGCIGRSIIATGGQEAIEGLDEFGNAYEEGEAAIFDRTEMITAVEAWTQCMSQAGHLGFAELDDPETGIRERLDEITAPIDAAIDAVDDEQMRAFVEGDTIEIEDLPGLDVDALRELQADERSIAIVDLDCYDAEVRAIHEPLRDEFERGLIDEYSNQLDALRNIGQ